MMIKLKSFFSVFSCSCRESGIPMTNMLLFCGSADIVPVVESMGVMAVFHEPSFAYVSKSANYEYLDPVFVDMVRITKVQFRIMISFRL